MYTEFITLENQIDLKVWLQSCINECDSHIGWREDYVNMQSKLKKKDDTTEVVYQLRLEELSNYKFRKRWLEVQLSKF
jgi:hypothetical protein